MSKTKDNLMKLADMEALPIVPQVVTKLSARDNLKALSKTCRELAIAAGRTDVAINTLLKELYQLTDAELKTFDEWAAEGAVVRKGQKAYLFWGAPTTNKSGITYSPVRYLFSKEQVHAA